MNRRFFFLTTAVLLACTAMAGNDEDVSEARKANIAKCEARLATNKTTFSDVERYFVARGVVADKQARTVTLDAFTTGVGQNDIAEFLLITENSGHGYESLFSTFATSDDICKAIEFIGVPRGISVNYSTARFWPKGERLNAMVSIASAPAVVLDSFVTSTETGLPLSKEGFVYVGDRRNADGAFIGDASGPGSVIASYNEPFTVMDVPRMAVQEAVYEKYRVSSNVVATADLWSEIILSPEPRPAASPLRVRDVAVSFSTNGVALDGGDVVSFKTALEMLQAYSAADRDVYATLRWSEALRLSQIQDFCRVLQLVDVDNGIRIEPPTDGDPYYKAFLPQEDWRDRTKRFSQPCELRFAADGSATLVAIQELWEDDAIKPELKIEEIPGVTVETLPQLLKDKGPELSVLLVFAPGTLEYGQIKPFLKTVKNTHANIHVFVD